MPRGVVREYRDHLEPLLPIELGCLEAMRDQNELMAAAPDRLCFGLGEQATAEPLAANGRRHPDLTQLARLSPRVPRCTCHHVSRFVAQEDADTSAVPDSGGVDVELVESVLEKFDVRRSRLFDLKATHRVLHRPPLVLSYPVQRLA